MKKILLLCALTFCLADFCFAKEKFKPGPDLQRLADYMTGYFSSEAQALADTDYFDIRLRMQRVWQNRTDGYWLYVEQAVAGYEAKPYRQRVYRVSQIDTDLFQSRIYKIPEPLRFASAWQEKNPLANLTPESLEYKPGTLIILMSKPDGSFVGSTIGKECPSELHGAVYTSTQVMINAEGLDTWDRGYDQNDEQVWGPEKSGYIFKKIENFPLE